MTEEPVIGVPIHRGLQPEPFHVVREFEDVITTQSSSIPAAHYELIDRARKMKRDLIIVHEDVEPEPGAIEMLLMHDRELEPIVAGVYPLRQTWLLPDGEKKHPLSVGWWEKIEDKTQHLGMRTTVPRSGTEIIDFVSLGFCLFRYGETMKKITNHAFRSLHTQDDGVMFSLWAKDNGIPLRVCWGAMARHWNLTPLEVPR